MPRRYGGSEWVVPETHRFLVHSITQMIVEATWVSSVLTTAFLICLVHTRAQIVVKRATRVFFCSHDCLSCMFRSDYSADYSKTIAQIIVKCANMVSFCSMAASLLILHISYL